jgi:hypothetical protein
VFIKISDMPDNVQRFIQLMKHPVKFRMFLFSKLPSAYFAGVRLHSMTEEKCAVSVPYKWFFPESFPLHLLRLPEHGCRNEHGCAIYGLPLSAETTSIHAGNKG